MTSLTERAERATAEQTTGVPAPAAGPAEPPAVPDLMADYEPGDDDPEQVPVHVAWLRVRREIRSIAKNQKYDEGRTKYAYRGADAVVQHFGPVTLRHGVHVLPVTVTTEYGEKGTKSGGKMRECTATVTWLIMGPRGDTLTLQTAGEALDTSDKATTKAQTVALRTLLLTAGLTPTGDPDPDAQRIERGEAHTRTPQSYRDEIVHPQTTPGRLEQISYELRDARMLQVIVQNENGDEETLDALGMRHYKERTAGGGSA